MASLVNMETSKVKEHIIEDYDALELLILRLYDIGFHSLDALTSLSGMNRDIVERALNRMKSCAERLTRE